MERKRDLTLDYAKGFAMLSIVIGHVYFYSGRYAGSWVFDVCDTIQIPVFMYISGLLAHKSLDRYGFRKLVKLRAVRLMLPFLSFYVIKIVLDYHELTELPLSEFKHGYWFMIVLFELMITLSLIRSIANRLKVPSYYVNILLFTLVTAYQLVIPKGNTFNMLFCINLYWHYYPFFMLGFYYYKLFWLMKWKYVSVFLGVYIASLYVLHVYNVKICSPLCNLSSLLLLMILFRKGFRPLESLFAKLGENSLQVYMLHFFLLLPLCAYLPLSENLYVEFVCIFLVAACVIFVTLQIAFILMKSDWLNLFLFGVMKRKNG